MLYAKSGGLKLEREDVEAIVGPTDCAKDDGAFGNGMIHLRVSVSILKGWVEIIKIISIYEEKRRTSGNTHEVT